MKMPTLAQRLAWEHHVQESQRRAGMKTQSLAQRMQAEAEKAEAEKTERERALALKKTKTGTKSVAMPTVEEEEDYVLV
jgi:hypothetical protein